MSAGIRTRPPTLQTGIGIATRAVDEVVRGRTTIVVADRRVSASRIGPADAAARITLDPGSIDDGAIIGLARSIRDLMPDVLVAVGGGTVIDAVKIAALAAGGGRLLEYVIEHTRHSALTFVPTRASGVELVAVATTPGTSAESNAVAVLRNARGHRLVVGSPLRPDHAVLDGRLFLTLPESAIREGCLEALLRVAGASTGGRGGALARSHAIQLGCALVRSGDEPLGSAARRLRVARLSAATQRTAALRGRDPYAARHWYVANEVAFHLGVRKMSATAPLMSGIWARIAAGDTRWGDRASLQGFWHPIARQGRLPRSPSAGIAALLERWRIERPQRPSGQTLDRIAEAAEQSWGRPSRILQGLGAHDIRALLQHADWAPRPRSSSRPGKPSGRDSTSGKGGEKE